MADHRTASDRAGQRTRATAERTKKLADTRAAERRDVIRHLQDYDIRNDIHGNSEAWGPAGMSEEVRDAIASHFDNAIERIVESMMAGAHEGLADG